MIRPECVQIDKVRAAVTLTPTRIKRRAARDSNIHLRQGLNGNLRVIRPITSTFARF